MSVIAADGERGPYLVVNTSVIRRDIVRVEKQPFLNCERSATILCLPKRFQPTSLKARYRRGYFHAASQEIR